MGEGQGHEGEKVTIKKEVDLSCDKKGMAPTWRLSQLSNDEYSTVVKVLAERLQNSFHMVAESRAEQALKLLENREIRETDEITVKIDMIFVWTDILDIVGGLRRKKNSMK